VIVVDRLMNYEGMYHGKFARMAHRVGTGTGHLWCHMMSTLMGDEGIRELDAMARKLGMRTAWRDGDHYDLTPGRRVAAVKLGAYELQGAQYLELVKAQRSGGPLPEWAQEKPAQGRLL
jgi:hypothetical protein